MGQEGAELVEDAALLTVAPTPGLGGYASAPGWSTNENTVPITGVGSARPFGFKKQRRESSMNGSVLLAGAPANDLLIRAALRYDAAITTARSNCLPLISLATGYAGRCGGGASVVTGRFGMVEQLSIQWGMNQIVRMTYQARMLTLSTSTSFTAPTEAAIQLASGDPYSWHDCAWTLKAGGVGSAGWDNILNSASLTISNTLEYDGTRRPDTANGDANPLSRAPYHITAMGQAVTFEANTQDVPAYLDGLVCVMGYGTYRRTLTLGGMVSNTGAQDETQADARFGFPNTWSVSTADWTVPA